MVKIKCVNIKHTLKVVSNKVFKKRVFYPSHHMADMLPSDFPVPKRICFLASDLFSPVSDLFSLANDLISYARGFVNATKPLIVYCTVGPPCRHILLPVITLAGKPADAVVHKIILSGAGEDTVPVSPV